jgi:hypothetical protein
VLITYVIGCPKKILRRAREQLPRMVIWRSPEPLEMNLGDIRLKRL